MKAVGRACVWESERHEEVDQMAVLPLLLPPPQIRPKLLAAYRTAVLNRDDQGQATYLNLLLRNYLTPSGGELRLVEQADKLVSLTKSTFPESASNNQFARYFYYTGMIKTIQLGAWRTARGMELTVACARQNGSLAVTALGPLPLSSPAMHGTTRVGWVPAQSTRRRSTTCRRRCARRRRMAWWASASP